MAREETRQAIFAQPEWLRAVPTDCRLPDGRVLHTGCGTSFHAAQTGGWAEQALELVLRPREADALVVISHEGDTPLTLEAARAFNGPVWLITAKPESPLGELADELAMEPATLSPLVKRLEAQGRGSRSRRTADERVLDGGGPIADTRRCDPPCPGGGMADAGDSKSLVLTDMRVRLPPRAPPIACRL